ncbi:MAG: hypothetical protein ABW019_12110 [Chitinophagaceae bacterium]
MVATLYRSVLVDTGTAEPAAATAPIPVQADAPAPAETAAPAWKYLGHNRKNILIVVEHTDVLHLPDEDLGLLTNILTACRLDLGDVAIINRNNHRQSVYGDYLDYFGSRNVLLFGMDPAGFGLPVDFPAFQVQSLAGCTFLHAPALSQCHDKVVKTQLWTSLKRIFNL